MQVNSLFFYKNSIHRVLALSDSSVLLIHCQKHTMPFWVPLSELSDSQQYSEEDLLTSAHIVPLDALSPQKKKLAHQRFTVISPILPFISTDSIRSSLISQIAKDNNLTKQTVRKYLCLYLAYQTISALVPSEKGTAPLSQDEKNFRWALNRYFYSSLKHGLKGTYELMLKEKYTDAAGVLLDTHPPFHRFRYFYNKTKKLQNYYIARDGLSNYQRNHRPLLGEGIREFAPSIGVGLLDSTILDIYIVNDEGQLVGRPILTACIDAYSGLCCGYALTWEGGVYSLQRLFESIIADKVTHCQNFGIHITKDDWNCHDILPATLVTDKGKEYTSYLLEQLTDLGVTIINLPPYRPDLKSSVEQFFNTIQNLYKPHLKGKGVIESDYQERGVKDYRKTARLTLRDFETILIKCILFYNTKRVIRSFDYTQEMLESSVQPFACSLWNEALYKPEANIIKVNAEQLRLTLLPRSKGTFTRTGLKFKKLRYHAAGFTEQYLSGGDCLIAYDPADTSCVWLYQNGEYTPFSLIDKTYRNQSFAAVQQHLANKNDYLERFESNSLQAKLGLIDDIEAIGAHRHTSGDTDLSGVRATRTKEKSKQRMNR